jgi:hypothetical protein
MARRVRACGLNLVRERRGLWENAVPNSGWVSLLSPGCAASWLPPLEGPGAPPFVSLPHKGGLDIRWVASYTNEEVSDYVLYCYPPGLLRPRKRPYSSPLRAQAASYRIKRRFVKGLEKIGPNNGTKCAKLSLRVHLWCNIVVY